MRDRPSRWPAGRQLWVLVIGMAIFELVLTVAANRVATGPSVSRGQDFMAFYTAGKLAAEGRAADVYDLATLKSVQHDIAAEAHLQETNPFSPWLNPPYAALIFIPFGKWLGFRAALFVWTAFSLACLATSAWLLSRMIGEASPLRRHRWLIFAVAFCSVPTLLALGHGQNTPLSLLLLTLAVVAWRGGRPIAAGLACAALAYKPHLAGIVAVACFASLGWRVLIGLAAGGTTLLVATLALLPGALIAFLTKMPGNAHAIFVERRFNWQRHVTFFGFTRHLFHGNGPGANAAWIGWLTAGLILCVAIAAIVAWWKLRPALRTPGAEGATARDRLIVLAVLATPLIAPYFLDYDLLLPLCVGGALVGRELLAADVDARPFRGFAMLTYVWLMMNALVADAIGASLTTPLLVTVFALHARRCATLSPMTREQTSTLRIAPRRRDGGAIAA